jgi:hypothetical protein
MAASAASAGATGDATGQVVKLGTRKGQRLLIPLAFDFGCRLEDKQRWRQVGRVKSGAKGVR